MNHIIRKIAYLIPPLLFIVTSLFSATVGADTKVVIIPMGGDQKPAGPFMPVAENSPANSHYTTGPGTVTDNITGLIWQQQDSSVKYSWDGSLAYCASLTLDSKNSWRLPDIHELQSIVDYNNSSPAINTVVFSSTETDPSLWSATSGAYGADVAWAIYFYTGSANLSGKGTNYYARCVR